MCTNRKRAHREDVDGSKLPKIPLVDSLSRDSVRYVSINSEVAHCNRMLDFVSDHKPAAVKKAHAGVLTA